MLDERDLKLLKNIMDESIAASEERMGKRMDVSISTAIAASEERMSKRMDESITSAITVSEERIMANTSRLIDEAEVRITKSTVALMDAEFTPKFNLLAEGIQEIREMMVPRTRIEELEEEVRFLKTVVRELSDRLSRLETA